MIPLPLARRILAEVSPDQLESENAAARAAGRTFDAHVQRRLDALRDAPRSHVYLAQLRAARRERERNILLTTIIPVDEPGSTADEEDRR